MVTPYTTAPLLILVGAAMFRSVARLSLAKMADALPPFLVIILIPLTFSVRQGILWGFVSHVALYIPAGRRREIHPVMYAPALAATGLLLLEHAKFS